MTICVIISIILAMSTYNCFFLVLCYFTLFAILYTLMIENLGLVLFTFFLILLNAFFVAAEFALVKIRASQVKEVGLEFKWRGRALSSISNNLEKYLSVCQLGITLASLGLGWIGEPVVASLLKDLFLSLSVSPPKWIHGLSFFIAFLIISFLHIVVGEQVPKLFAVKKSKFTSINVSFPLMGFYYLMYPFIVFLNWSSLRILKLLGFKGEDDNDKFSFNEAKLLMVDAEYEDEDFEKAKLVKNSVLLTELSILDLLHNINDLVFLYGDTKLSEVRVKIESTKYTRFPVFDRNSEDLLGVLHIKDFYSFFDKDSGDIPIEKFSSYFNEATVIGKNGSILKVLDIFKQGNTHLSLVKYNEKFIGYISLEDILEVIVGNISDEYAKVDKEMLKTPSGAFLVRGDTPLAKIQQEFGEFNNIPPDIHTISGLILNKLRNFPAKNDVVVFENFVAIVKKIKLSKILLIKLMDIDSYEDSTKNKTLFEEG